MLHGNIKASGTVTNLQHMRVWEHFSKTFKTGKEHKQETGVQNGFKERKKKEKEKKK